MIPRFTRIWSRWLRFHPVWGLAPRLAAVVMDPGDEDRLLLGPDHDIRLPCTVVDDIDDEALAKLKEPEVSPALAVVAQLVHSAPLQWARTREGGQLVWDASPMGFAYIERDTPVLHGRQRGGYVLSALMESIIAFNEPKESAVPIPTGILGLDPPPATTWRRLADIEILEVSELEEWRVQGGLGESTIIGSMFASCRVRRLLAR